MRRVKLGSQGLVVSAHGWGCIAMSTTYVPSNEHNEQEKLPTLARPLELVVTLLVLQRSMKLS
ncbi:hypothetical protein [Paraburkholderia sp. RL17-337-BIB-A]|uniref:hypothetical protein n=1 Tax=Paraburkholderia sp. RL17-337-BIB-A TaxID=3031636 RepID=UPI0038B96A07